MTRPRSICFALAVIALLAAHRVHAQDARLTERFPAAVAARLGATIDSAMHEGLPIEPLVLRALEGQAKGAASDQIIAAVSRLRSALRVSRNTLGKNASAIEVTTAAAALQVGVSETRLAELHKIRGTMTTTAPLNAYLDLTARGAPADGVWDRITDLARRRASDADFGRLTPADVNGKSKTIRPPGAPGKVESR